MNLRKLVITAVLLTPNLLISANLLEHSRPVGNQPNFLHVEWMDTHYSPGTDFFHYANGSWLRKNPIPADRTSWGTEDETKVDIENKVHAIAKSASTNNALINSDEKKIGDLYYSGMNVEQIEKEGVWPLTSELERIHNIKTLTDLQKVISHFQLTGVNALYTIGNMQDFYNNKKIIAYIEPAGLGLPDREYYLNNDPFYQKIRKAYEAHIASMFELLGDDKMLAQQEAKDVMKIETCLATYTMSTVERSNYENIYHIYSVKNLNSQIPAIHWDKYFSDLGVSNINEVNVTDPNFFTHLNSALQEVSLAHWKSYLRWQLIHFASPYLSSSFVIENFKLTNLLTGKEIIQPRWKSVMEIEDKILGFALGKIYVDRYFSEADKKYVLNMASNIRNAMRTSLSKASWMSSSTKSAALKKLNAMQIQVGYPDKWVDYLHLKVDRDSYVKNIFRGNAFVKQRELSAIGKPVNLNEWYMSPQTFNAYYDPSRNTFYILAGILNSPEYNIAAPAAINYGGIGATIGHEMLHGFDKDGAKFDSVGNMSRWWLPKDLENFNRANECIAHQFSGYAINSTIFTQGKLVTGEASADLGGLTMAYHAFLNSKEYQSAKAINGFTPEQQFFLSFGHIWAEQGREEQEILAATTNTHPLPKFRVNGTLENMPEFYHAFKLPMKKTSACKIW